MHISKELSTEKSQSIYYLIFQTFRDNWGRKWCHLVAIDAIFFRDRAIQYEMQSVKRELIKAFAGFRPRPAHTGAENLFGIATGHWGCGAFNGDKQLKGIKRFLRSNSYF
jgi:poly(ADP-ribose) glycohydrolase